MRSYSRAQACSAPVRWSPFYHTVPDWSPPSSHEKKPPAHRVTNSSGHNFLQSQSNFPQFGSQAAGMFLRLQKTNRKENGCCRDVLKVQQTHFKQQQSIFQDQSNQEVEELKQCIHSRQPTPVFMPGEFHGQRSLAGYSPWGHKESDMTE